MLWADWAGILEKQAGRGSRTSWAVRLEACQTDYKVRWSVLQRLPESAFSWKKRAFGYSPTPAHFPSPTSRTEQMGNLDHLFKTRKSGEIHMQAFPQADSPIQQKVGTQSDLQSAHTEDRRHCSF